MTNKEEDNVLMRARIMMKYEDLLADRATGHPAMTDEYTIDTMADFLLVLSTKIAMMQEEIDSLRQRLDEKKAHVLLHGEPYDPNDGKLTKGQLEKINEDLLRQND
jgi:uncharacterized small protein (DUF1192 family)